MAQLAVIGAGRIGKIHAQNVAVSRRLDLKWVVDPVADAASRLAAEFGARTCSFEEVLRDGDVAGVIVASSTDTHLDFALAAARAGKAVFCEKPLDMDYKRAKASLAEFDRLNARVLLAFNRRFDPNFSRLHAKLKAGVIGELETLHIISHDPAPPPLDYLKGSGGIFKDMVIHDFDMARWMLGEEPVAVFSSSSVLVDKAIGEVGDADTAKTILRTQSGRLCVISSSRRSGYGYDQRIEAFGSQGLIRAENARLSTVETWQDGGSSQDEFQNFFLDRYKDAYGLEMDHFAEIIDGSPPLVSCSDGALALALAEAAERSVISNKFEMV